MQPADGKRSVILSLRGGMLIFLREAKTSTTQLLSIKRLFIIICRQAILEKIEGLPVQKGTACCHGSASSQRCSLASAVSTASLGVGLGTCPPTSVWSSVPRYRNARAVLPTLIPSPHRQSQGDETWFGGTMRMPQEPRHNRRPKLAVSRGGEQTHPTVPLSATKPLCTSGQSLPLGTVWSCPPPRCSYSPVPLSQVFRERTGDAVEPSGCWCLRASRCLS